MNSLLQLHFKTRKLILIYTAVQTGGIRYRIPRRYGQTCKICFRISKITSISIKLKEKKKKKRNGNFAGIVIQVRPFKIEQVTMVPNFYNDEKNIKITLELYASSNWEQRFQMNKVGEQKVEGECHCTSLSRVLDKASSLYRAKPSKHSNLKVANIKFLFELCYSLVDNRD